jgi:hypothetical protein
MLIHERNKIKTGIQDSRGGGLGHCSSRFILNQCGNGDPAVTEWADVDRFNAPIADFIGFRFQFQRFRVTIA